MAINKTWAQRCAEDATRPMPMRMQSANAPLGGNSPTEVYGIIENTPGNTPLNRAKGALYKFPNTFSPTGTAENPYEWLGMQGMSESYYWNRPQ